jgi:hypothetical protein
MIVSSQASFAAAQCYDEIEVEDPMACGAQDPNNKSADFTSGCDLGGTKIIKVPRECAAKWVAYGAPNPASRAFATPYKALKHSEVCAKAGLLPTTIDGASCASGTYYGTDVSQTSSNEGGSSNGSGGQRTVTSIFCVGGKDSGNNAPTGVWGSEPGDGVQAQQHLLTHYACGE